MIALSLWITPDLLEGASLFIFAARCPAEVTGERMWYEWKDASAAITEVAKAPTGPTEIPVSILHDGFMPSATSARGFVVPIDELRDETSLEERLVRPAFELLR